MASSDGTSALKNIFQGRTTGDTGVGEPIQGGQQTVQQPEDITSYYNKTYIKQFRFTNFNDREREAAVEFFKSLIQNDFNRVIVRRGFFLAGPFQLDAGNENYDFNSSGRVGVQPGELRSKFFYDDVIFIIKQFYEWLEQHPGVFDSKKARLFEESPFATIDSIYDQLRKVNPQDIQEVENLNKKIIDNKTVVLGAAELILEIINSHSEEAINQKLGEIQAILSQIENAGSLALQRPFWNELVLPLLRSLEQTNDGEEGVSFNGETYGAAAVKLVINRYFRILQDNAAALNLNTEKRLSSGLQTSLTSARPPFEYDAGELLTAQSTELGVGKVKNRADNEKNRKFIELVESLIEDLQKVAATPEAGGEAEAEEGGGEATEPTEETEEEELRKLVSEIRDEIVKAVLNHPELNLNDYLAGKSLDTRETGLAQTYIKQQIDNFTPRESEVQQFLSSDNYKNLGTAEEKSAARENYIRESSEKAIAGIKNFYASLEDWAKNLLDSYLQEIKTETVYTVSESYLKERATAGIPTNLDDLLNEYRNSLSQAQINPRRKESLAGALATLIATQELVRANPNLSFDEANNLVRGNRELWQEFQRIISGLDQYTLANLETSAGRIRFFSELSLRAQTPIIQAYIDQILSESQNVLDTLKINQANLKNLDNSLDALILLINDPESFIRGINSVDDIEKYFNIKIKSDDLDKFKKALLVKFAQRERYLITGSLRSEFNLKEFRAIRQLVKEKGYGSARAILFTPIRESMATADRAEGKIANGIQLTDEEKLFHEQQETFKKIVKAWAIMDEEAKIGVYNALGISPDDSLDLPDTTTGRLVAVMGDRIASKKKSFAEGLRSAFQAKIALDNFNELAKEPRFVNPVAQFRRKSQEIRRLSAVGGGAVLTTMIYEGLQAVNSYLGLIGGVLGSAAGATLGSFVGPIGTIFGGAGGFWAGAEAGSRFEELLGIRKYIGRPSDQLGKIDLSGIFRTIPSPSQTLASASTAPLQTTLAPAQAAHAPFFQTMAGVGTATATTIGATAIIVSATIQSAFLVPINPEAQEDLSKYVSVQKVSRPSQLQNEDLEGDNQVEVEYTIKITPKFNSETNRPYQIQVNNYQDKLTASGGKDSVVPNVESPTQVITEQMEQGLSEDGLIIAPFEFSYYILLTEGKDALVSNTFTVDFEVLDDQAAGSQTIKASNALIIGNPGLGCFDFSNEIKRNNDGDGFVTTEWTADDIAMVQGAYVKRAGQSIEFNKKLFGNQTSENEADNGENEKTSESEDIVCTENNMIHLHRVDVKLKYGGFRSGNDIYFYNLAFDSSTALEYTLVHELGHMLDGRTGNDYRQQYTAARNTASCFTYPLACSDGEAFAEGIALTIIHDFYIFPSLDYQKYVFPSEHPTEYNWFVENIFGGCTFDSGGASCP